MNNEFRSRAAAECDRVLNTLATLAPTDEAYPTVLRCLTDLFYLSGPHLGEGEAFSKTTAPCELPAFEEAPAPAAEEPAPDEPWEDAEPQPAPEQPEVPVLKKETVRAALAEAKSNGVIVSGIIQSFGVSKFSDIPAERYPEVMEKLREASK